MNPEKQRISPPLVFLEKMYSPVYVITLPLSLVEK
jgi:hypothetical protein